MESYWVAERLLPNNNPISNTDGGGPSPRGRLVGGVGAELTISRSR
jgi:hypothetical protein